MNAKSTKITYQALEYLRYIYEYLTTQRPCLNVLNSQSIMNYKHIFYFTYIKLNKNSHLNVINITNCA